MQLDESKNSGDTPILDELLKDFRPSIRILLNIKFPKIEEVMVNLFEMAKQGVLTRQDIETALSELPNVGGPEYLMRENRMGILKSLAINYSNEFRQAIR